MSRWLTFPCPVPDDATFPEAVDVLVRVPAGLHERLVELAGFHAGGDAGAMLLRLALPGLDPAAAARMEAEAEARAAEKVGQGGPVTLAPVGARL